MPYAPRNPKSANRSYMRELFGKAQDNHAHLMLVRRALTDIIEHELTERQKQILHLYYFEGKNGREISEMLYVNKSTVSRTLYRARERIRKNLRFYFDYRKPPDDD